VVQVEDARMNEGPHNKLFGLHQGLLSTGIEEFDLQCGGLGQTELIAVCSDSPARRNALMVHLAVSIRKQGIGIAIGAESKRRAAYEGALHDALPRRDAGVGVHFMDVRGVPVKNLERRLEDWRRYEDHIQCVLVESIEDSKSPRKHAFDVLKRFVVRNRMLGVLGVSMPPRGFGISGLRWRDLPYGDQHENALISLAAMDTDDGQQSLMPPTLFLDRSTFSAPQKIELRGDYPFLGRDQR
jgi:hypothetical protein